ncbi:hypothetical protein GCM10010136_01940 [Limoniibacter endophyticus]|uniref:Uncharacterized protein n=1 Tax=Limoniibacter endophyticus TaxID=1565040 RepID=A0A8J3DLF2_9HYPH|nr:hypothetical protein GCM10010136_01940 [Limoniibacter endophyticus]
MNIGYDDLGQPKEPGEYRYNGNTYEAKSKHIEAWQEDASIRFHVTQFGALQGPKRLILSSRVY